MRLSEYQEQAVVTAVYGAGMAIWYPALGLAGEAGEVSNKVKKIFRDAGGVVSDERREQLKGELGDCLWYLAGLARDLGLSLEEAAIENIAKLRKRLANNTIKGDGDNR